MVTTINPSDHPCHVDRCVCNTAVFMFSHRVTMFVVDCVETKSDPYIHVRDLMSSVAHLLFHRSTCRGLGI